MISTGDSRELATVGALRNTAIENATMPGEYCADIIAHWDSDDYSHPARIAEQVALLQASGADAVGYRECLFFDERSSEAWLYTQKDMKSLPGGTLCYWRRTWKRKPFPDRMTGEDSVWMEGLNVVGASSVESDPRISIEGMQPPRFIARIHQGNTSKVYKPELMRAVEAQGGEWKRVPAWDDYCAARMRL